MRSVVGRVSSGGAPATNMSLRPPTTSGDVFKRRFKGRVQEARAPRSGLATELLLEQKCPAAFSSHSLYDLVTPLSQQVGRIA